MTTTTQEQPDDLAKARQALVPFASMADQIDGAMGLVDDPDRREHVEIVFGGMSLGTMLVSDFEDAYRAFYGDEQKP